MYNIFLLYYFLSHIRRVTQLVACQDDTTYLSMPLPHGRGLLSGYPCQGTATRGLLHILLHFKTAISHLTFGESVAGVELLISAAWMLTAAAASDYGALAAVREVLSMSSMICVKVLILASLLTVSVGCCTTLSSMH